MANTKNKTPISKNIEENEKFLKDRLGIGVSFDVGVRKYLYSKKSFSYIIAPVFVTVNLLLCCIVSLWIWIMATDLQEK